jgi:hypothetical protein
MRRGWGDSAGQKLGAPGLQVSILQKFLGSFIPETSMGNTGSNGNVSIDAVDGGSTRGATGLCIELKNDAAKIVGDSIFFLPEEICDFRAFVTGDPNGTTGTPSGFRLQIKSEPQSIHIQNTLLAGLYEADDAYRYAQRVVGLSAKQARIITGYWADTIAPNIAGGKKNLFTPCLNYPNSLSDLALGVGVAAGAAAGSIGGPFGTVLGALTGAYISLHIGNADIIMSENSLIPVKRAVMSHEMGHYLFCSMLQEEESSSINWLILQTIANSREDGPVRYLNEAVADFFTGQVAGGADYGWAANAGFTKNGDSYFCAPVDHTNQPDVTPTCWETNSTLVGNGEKDPASIGRIATLLYDAVDSSNTSRKTLRVEPGTAWQWTQTTTSGTTTGDYPLVNSSLDYIMEDFENVTIGKTGIRDFAHRIARSLNAAPGMATTIEALGGLALNKITSSDLVNLNNVIGGALNDAKIYRALNDTMAAKNYSWCDRCSVLALHEPGASAPTGWSPELFKACRDDSFLVNALNEAPPDTSLNLNRTTCTVCPAGTIHNSDYTSCDPCNGVVVDDTCQTCPADVVLDATEMTIGQNYHFAASTPQATDDVCPNVTWVEVTNVSAMFSTHSDAVSLSASLAYSDSDQQAGCERRHSFYQATQVGTGDFSYSTTATNGVYPKCDQGGICLTTCSGLPSSTVTPTQQVSNVMFGIPANGLDTLDINTSVYEPPPT